MNKIMGFNDWNAGSSPKASKVEEDGGIKADEGKFLETIKSFLKDPKGKDVSKLKKANSYLKDLSRKRKKNEYKESERKRIDEIIKELEEFINNLKKPKQDDIETRDVSLGAMPIEKVEEPIETEQEDSSSTGRYNENQVIAMKMWMHDNCDHHKIKSAIILGGGLDDGSHTPLFDEAVRMCVNRGYVNSEEHLLMLALDEAEKRKERSQYSKNVTFSHINPEYIPKFNNDI